MIFLFGSRVVTMLGAAALFAAFTSAAPVWAVDSGESSGGSSALRLDVGAEMDEARKFIRLGRYSSAIETLRDVVQQDRRNADAYNLLGFASRKLKKTRDAARYYDAALKIDPNHLGALEYQGELFLTLHKPEKAKANLARLLKLCGANCHEYKDLKEYITAYQGS